MLYNINGKAKDPAVIRFGGRYIMYHSTWIIGQKILRIAIAESDDMETWKHIGYVPITQECEAQGIGAPGAIVIGDTVHLFYQTYGNGRKDALCHAKSKDGVRFTKNNTNPIFAPSESWCCGRAIDADAAVMNGRLYLYFASRDHEFKKQIIGVCSADVNSEFLKEDFREENTDAPILAPEAAWEGDCIEAPATIVKDGKMFLFYGGSYNCTPQQIGVAVSSDGVHFEKMDGNPFFEKGEKGSWNESESGHPYVFEDDDGKVYLFYQGSPDMGKTWWLSRMEIEYKDGKWHIVKLYND